MKRRIINLRLSIILLALIADLVFCLCPLMAQEIVSSLLIWSQEGKYAAFTTLAKYKRHFYCAFRQANSHVNKNGMDNAYP